MTPRIVLSLLVGSLPLVGLAAGKPSGSGNNTIEKITQAVTLEAVRAHQAAFQAIADANGGDRVSGSAGYNASAAYVVNSLAEAGYDVAVQPFEFQSFFTLSPSVFEQTAPGSVVFLEGQDFSNMAYSGSGDATAPVQAVALQLGLGNASTSGCEAADFAGFTPGNIALIQRGACTFLSKARNAEAAGAVGVIIFNQGNTAERTGLFAGTLGTSSDVGIPVVSTTYTLGELLAGTPGLQVRLKVDAFRGVATTWNVFAETPWGDPANVVIVGAGLGSVDGSPGINYSGSGSAAILETAIQMAGVKTRAKVRFAWWGAEEAGLLGSEYYLNSLSEEQRGSIAAYLGFDVIGSPNFARFVISSEPPAPEGSAAIEAFLAQSYALRGAAFEPASLVVAGTLQRFALAGIPVGGIFAGAGGIKTAEQALAYGGVAGQQYDPCTLVACDTYDNVSLDLLDLNADVVAAAVLQFGMNTSGVNGEKGKGDFKPGKNK